MAKIKIIMCKPLLAGCSVKWADFEPCQSTYELQHQDKTKKVVHGARIITDFDTKTHKMTRCDYEAGVAKRPNNSRVDADKKTRKKVTSAEFPPRHKSSTSQSPQLIKKIRHQDGTGTISTFVQLRDNILTQYYKSSNNLRGLQYYNTQPTLHNSTIAKAMVFSESNVSLLNLTIKSAMSLRT